MELLCCSSIRVAAQLMFDQTPRGGKWVLKNWKSVKKRTILLKKLDTFYRESDISLGCFSVMKISRS